MTLQCLFDKYGYSNVEDDVNGEKTGLFMNIFMMRMIKNHLN